MRNLAVLLIIGLIVYCVIDVIRSTTDERLGVHPILWVALILVVPLLGALAWLAVRWSRRTAGGPDPSARQPAAPPGPTTTRTSCRGWTTTAAAPTRARRTTHPPALSLTRSRRARRQMPEYECLPVTTRLTTVKLASTTAYPTNTKYDARRPLQPRVVRACR